MKERELRIFTWERMIRDILPQELNKYVSKIITNQYITIDNMLISAKILD